MNTIKTLSLALLGIMTLSSCGDDAEPLNEGVSITLRNTLQDPGEAEGTYAALFMQADEAFDEFATLSNSSSEFANALAQPGTPFGDISGLYEIDFTESKIDFTLLPSIDDPFWSRVFEVFPSGKFDRYYFTFSEPHNISGSTSNNNSVRLRIDSETVVVVEISEGYNMNPGTMFSITLDN